MINTSIYLTDEQYLEALDKLQVQIKDGLKLKKCDDTTPGNKSTTCSWGLCTNSNKVWGAPETNLRPKYLPNETSRKYPQKTHKCPFDRRKPDGDFSSGCFYHCRLFGGEVISREKAHEHFTQTKLSQTLEIQKNNSL